VDWPSLFNVDDPVLATRVRPIVLVCLTVFIINVPLSLVTRVRYAYQQVSQSNMWQAAGSLWSIPVVIYAVQASLSPVVVVAASVIGPPVANAVNSAWLYLRQLPRLTPGLRHADREIARDLFGLGGRFFAVTVLMSVAINADTLIIAHTLGLTAVATYAVAARLLAQLGILVTLVNLPLWPANGEALARGDTAWVRTMTRRMTFGSTLCVLLPAIPFVLVGGSLLEAWLGTPLDASRGLLLALAAWWVLQAAISPRFMVQNSAGVIRPQLIGWSLYLVVSLPAKWFAAQTLGLVAVPAVGVALYAATVLPSAIKGYRQSIGSAATQGLAQPTSIDRSTLAMPGTAHASRDE
jgi:O-antigen/teichoic acid export membrane protein